MTFTVTNIGEHSLALGDCFDVFEAMEDSSVDMILADLPYGTTYAKWDSVLPLDALWAAYRRIAKPGCPIILTASQPFTSQLVMSKPEWFRCEWIWNKENAANFANAKKQPLKQHESVLVFSVKQHNYFPQKTPGNKNHVQGKNAKANVSDTRLISERVDDDLSGMKYPKTIIDFPKHSSQCGFHPTQKPVELLAYLIRTYSQPGDVVFDNTMGSGSTGVACSQEGRIFKGIEKDATYFDIACKRVRESIQ